ncbi:MAG: hypothetical protein KDD61_18180, partial [Bdellovibrionales bacterium]|nr:hypothetical protein [Bdellovibrionales bacterium]
MNIVELIKEKNEYLEKFYNVNLEEISRFADGDFENLENFYQSRAALLDMISSVDRRIEESNVLDSEEVEMSPE